MPFPVYFYQDIVVMTADLLISFPRLESSIELVSFRDFVIQSFSRE